MTQNISLGLDIGTTTVSAVAVEVRSRKVLCAHTEKTSADLPGRAPGEKCQDGEKILALAQNMLDRLLQQYPQARSIGLTGQMHGIVYPDREGNPLSPLYTWQDQQGAHYCRELGERTGYPAAPGYGLVTHYALQDRGAVPEGAWKLCTVMDCLAFRLCGKEKLLMHASNAASLGFFSLETGSFDENALNALGIGPELLPEVTRENRIQGTYRGIPVAVAIGDNQASFLGAVPDPEKTALVNFGTGSQISLMTRQLPGTVPGGALEVRPYLEGTYLLCGSALCGGRAYALLERFFRSFAVRCGLPEGECYGVLNDLAREGLALSRLPRIETTFCGTRADPDKLGSVTELGEEAFTPAAFAAGTLLGMARELKELFAAMPGGHIRSLAAAGNAIRKNPALVQAVQREFGMDAAVAACPEEAAFGAALFGAMAAGNASCI